MLVDNRPVGDAQGKSPDPPRSTTLPAAVLRHDDPQADKVARVVPRGAEVRKVGKCVLGYVHNPARTKPRPSFAERAVWVLEAKRVWPGSD